MDNVAIQDGPALFAALAALHDSADPTNFVVIKYADVATVRLEATGTTGLAGLRDALAPLTREVVFACAEVVVQGDSYNQPRIVLVCSVGRDVPPGMLKARASGHRGKLKAILNEKVPIAAEFQPEDLADLNEENLGQALTKVRGAYHGAKSSTGSGAVQSRSSAAVARGGKALAALKLDNPEAIDAALKAVHKGDADFALLAYTLDRPDVVELVQQGQGGASALAACWPTDRILYAMARVPIRADLVKYVLVSMIGEQVSPMKKARSSAQRSAISDFILSSMPLHAQLQPGGPDDITDAELKAKFKD